MDPKEVGIFPGISRWEKESGNHRGTYFPKQLIKYTLQDMTGAWTMGQAGWGNTLTRTAYPTYP